MFNDSRNRLKFQEPPTIFSKIPRFSSFFFLDVVFFLLFDDIFIKMEGVRRNAFDKIGKLEKTGVSWRRFARRSLIVTLIVVG